MKFCLLHKFGFHDCLPCSSGSKPPLVIGEEDFAGGGRATWGRLWVQRPLPRSPESESQALATPASYSGTQMGSGAREQREQGSLLGRTPPARAETRPSPSLSRSGRPHPPLNPRPHSSSPAPRLMPDRLACAQPGSR